MTLEKYKEQIDELILRYGKETNLMFHKVDNNGNSHAVPVDLASKAQLGYIPDSEGVNGEHFLIMKI